MAVCLPKIQADKILKALKGGEINPVELVKMLSEERRTAFEKVVGKEYAKTANALFEGKLILKNQRQGIINWAKGITGIKPEVLRTIEAKVSKMTDVLTPKNEQAFLEDLVEKRLGFEVTPEEAKNITEFSSKLEEKRKQIDRKSADGSESRLEFGRALVGFRNYVNDLKVGAEAKTIGEYIKTPSLYGKAISNIGALAKSLKASLDNSVIGRQGWKVMATNPRIWLKNSRKTFSDIWNTFGGKKTMDEVKADVWSRENALNGSYAKEKLALGVIEEAYPTSLPERIPVLGKAFEASQNAFTGFQYRSRADIFDKYMEIAQKSGADIQGIGKIANSLTGRGSLGKLEPIADITNNLFFSPRFLKSHIDVLTVHAFDKGISSFARKQAAINTLKVITSAAAILMIADAVMPGSVEKDPRSADFGKIKTGNTRFDVSGGISGITTLTMRLAKKSTKSSVTGKITPINTGKFGSMTGMDLIYNFFENKLSPAAAVVRDLARGEMFGGEKPTVTGELSNLLMPLPIANIIEMQKDPNSANMLLGLIADSLGVGINTYGKPKK